MSLKNQFTAPILLLAFSICTLWFSAGYLSSQTTPIGEPDAPIYLQYARSAAQGHPLSYTPPDGPSTGSTSYLYPLLISPLYKLCGDAQFPNAVFAFQIGLFLVSLGLLASIAKKLIPENAWLALLATALSGQTIYTFLSLTDMGLLVTLVLLCAWALAHKKYLLLCVGSFFCGLTHPSSLAVSGGLVLCGICQAAQTRPARSFFRTLFSRSAAPAWAGVIGISTVALTMLCNYWLTGSAQFMSLRGKGLFTIYSLIPAVYLTAGQLIGLLKGLFFGLDSTTRQYFFLPVITGGMALTGVLSRKWKNKAESCFDIFVISSWIAGLVLMAMNERQNLSYDRYAAWMFPLIYLYLAIGIRAIAARFKTAATVLTVFFLGAQAACLLFFTTSFLMKSEMLRPNISFFQEVMERTHPGDRIGIEAASGEFWNLKDRKIFHIYGMFNPELATLRHKEHYLEYLKYQPNLRPAYWLIRDNHAITQTAHHQFVGEELARDIDSQSKGRGISFHKADWSRLSPLPPPMPAKWTLKQRLDVGYTPDEKEADYKISTPVPFLKTKPSISSGEMYGKPLTECGELVLGEETFRLQGISINIPLRVTLRTRHQETVCIRRYQKSFDHLFTMGSAISLDVTVNDRPLPAPVRIQLNEEGFTDASFTIPAVYITTSTPEIRIAGDHFAYAYWFYQEESLHGTKDANNESR